MKLLAALAFAIGLAGQPVAPPARVNFEGIVVNSVTGAGIAGAAVTANLHQAVTALDGTFTLTGVEEPWIILLSAQKSGFGCKRLVNRSFHCGRAYGIFESCGKRGGSTGAS